MKAEISVLSFSLQHRAAALPMAPELCSLSHKGMQDLLLSEQGWGRQDFQKWHQMKFISDSEAQLHFHKEFVTSVPWSFGLISHFELCIAWPRTF